MGNQATEIQLLNKELLGKGTPKSLDPAYQQWLDKNYSTAAELEKMTQAVELFDYQPTVSIITPVYNTDASFLEEAIQSVIAQIYPHWQLCLADDASTDSYVREILERYSDQDSRIQVIYREQNGHISAASNSALEIASGEFIALLDHDDLLAPDALYRVVELLNQNPSADMIYSDEDKVDENYYLSNPFFKPDWCPDSFLSKMYTCHLGVYRHSVVKEIGGFREGYEGSQDYDLVLRLSEKTINIFHLPYILYHWRLHPNSTSLVPASKAYFESASIRALSDALVRRQEPGRIETLEIDCYIPRYDIKNHDLVSIIIPSRDLGSTVDKCLNSIFSKTDYPNYEVVFIDNGSTEPKALDVLRYWKEVEEDRFNLYPYDIPFNYSKLNNYAVSKAKGKYLLFLNNDIEVLKPDWLTAMVEQAQRPSIGAVGARLLYPDDTIQHAGVVIGIGGVAGHSHKHFPAESMGYFRTIQTVNNYSAVTGACLMCRRDVFNAVNGFEEQLSVAFNDVDFCLKIFDLNYKNIYLPHVSLYHYESKSRGYEDTPEKQARFQREIAFMQAKWANLIEHDPCYSKHLTKEHQDYRIATNQ